MPMPQMGGTASVFNGPHIRERVNGLKYADE